MSKKKKKQDTEEFYVEEEVENVEEVSKYKDRLVKIIETQYEKFDQKTLYIAGGAFAISSVFIDKVVKLNEAIKKGYLVASLSIFAIVVLLALINHFISLKANTWALDNFDETDEKVFLKKRDRWNIPIQIINYLNIGLLIFGGIFLLYFININI